MRAELSDLEKFFGVVHMLNDKKKEKYSRIIKNIRCIFLFFIMFWKHTYYIRGNKWRSVALRLTINVK